MWIPNSKKEKPKSAQTRNIEYTDGEIYKINELYGLKIATRNEKEQKECNELFEELKNITDGLLDISQSRINFNATAHSVLFGTTYLVVHVFNKNDGQYNQLQEYEPNWGIYTINKNEERFIDVALYHKIKEELKDGIYSAKTNFVKFKDGKYFCPPEIRDACERKYGETSKSLNTEAIEEKNKHLDEFIVDAQLKREDNQKGWFVRE